MVAAGLPEHEVRILDLRLTDDATPLLRDFQPHACGIGCSFTTEVYRSLDIARHVKQVLPDCFVFIGGHHPTLCPEDCTDPAIDAIALGEAESVVSDLLAAIGDRDRLEGVPGLVLNRPDGQYITRPRAPIADLDALPFPARHLVADRRHLYYMGFHRPHALVETARGCPHRCKFCSVWRFYSGRLRHKSPERVLAELERVSAPHVFFTDDNFLSSVERAHRIADLITQHRIRKSYTFQARADTIARNPDLLAHWKSVGRITVFVGIEKTEEDALEELRKKSTIADNEKALSAMKELGVGFSCNFIVPAEADREEFARLRSYVLGHGLHSASYSVLTPLPGTELYDEMKGQLATRNYELFDLFHAVTPTKLPLEEFYREFASLWSTSRAGGCSHTLYRAWKLVKALVTRRTTISNLRFGMNMARTLSDPRAYLQAHCPAPRQHPPQPCSPEDVTSGIPAPSDPS